MTIERIQAKRDELRTIIHALTNEDKRQEVVLTLSKQLDELERCLNTYKEFCETAAALTAK